MCAYAQVHEQRLNRKVAFEKAKEHVSRWDAVVQKHREADRLEFPLQAPARSIVSNAALQVNFTPSNSLEKDLDALLTQYAFKEDAIKKREQDQVRTPTLLSSARSFSSCHP